MSELSYLFPTHALMAGGTYANPGIIAHVDAESNLTHLWAGLTAKTYYRSVRFGFRTFEMGRPAELLWPMVTSFHPAYQETIYGTEGVIVAKQVFVPFRTGYGDARSPKPA